MNIIIVGAGEIGRHLAASLSGAAHNIAVIERDEALASSFGQTVDAHVASGSGTSGVSRSTCDMAPSSSTR